MPQGLGHTNYEMWKLARRMNQLMDEWMHAGFRQDPEETWEPAVDLIECSDDFCLLADLAGMTREQVNVQITPSSVTLSGSRHLATFDCQTEIHTMELSRGIFRRTLQLPVKVDPDKAAIDMVNGLLEIRIPKKKE